LRCFDLHGVHISLECPDRSLEDAIRSRLSDFERPNRGGNPIRFSYDFVPTADAHAVDRPEGSGRPVYDPPAGEVLYFPSTDIFLVDYDGRVRVVCDCARLGVRVSVTDQERANLWLLSRPLFTLPLMELLKRRGLYSLHAAGVAANGRAALFAGGSGSGKSTLAVAHARHGFSLLGDDLVLLRFGEAGGIHALAFPDEVDVTSETASWFPELLRLAGRPVPAGWRKHRIRPEALFDRAAPEGAVSPAVLIFPAAAAAAESSVEPMSRDEALTELVPNVFLTEPRASQRHLDALADLVRQADCYRLITGRDFDRVPRLVRELLA
jgi:hypothetical protein